MDYHQRVLLVASAILNEATLAAVRYKDDEVRSAMIAMLSKEAKQTYESTLTQRFKERVKGKRLFNRVCESIWLAMWKVDQKDYMLDLMKTAKLLAAEELKGKTELDLKRLAVELTAERGPTLPDALSMVAKDMLQEAGL